jgi:hypothetical protein
MLHHVGLQSLGSEAMQRRFKRHSNGREAAEEGRKVACAEALWHARA